MLHGEQRFEYPRGLPRVGDRFHARQAFGRSFEKDGSQGRMHFQEVVTRFWRDDEADPDAIMTSLSITLPPIDDAPAEAAQNNHPATAKPTPETVGAEGASTELDRYVTEPLSITDFVRYQGAAGDFNPIHHDAEFAQRGGYDGPFAVGMHTAGVAAARFNEVRDPHRLRALRMCWQAPAWPGDRLTYVVTEEDGGLKCAVTRRSSGSGAGNGSTHGDQTEPHMTAWGTYA